MVPHLTDVVAAGGSDGLVDHLLTHNAVECLLDTTQQTSLRETMEMNIIIVQYNTVQYSTVLCGTNTYRQPTQLCVDGDILHSCEGITQGDPLAMPMYAIATLPLIKELRSETEATQVWYADDACAIGKIRDLRKWWELSRQNRSAAKTRTNFGSPVTKILVRR